MLFRHGCQAHSHYSVAQQPVPHEEFFQIGFFLSAISNTDSQKAQNFVTFRKDTQRKKRRKKRKKLAEDGFDPSTSGLWAQHASAAPLCFPQAHSYQIQHRALTRPRRCRVESALSSSASPIEHLARHALNSDPTAKSL